MAFDLVPRRFWSFPASSWFDLDEDDMSINQSSSTGVSISEDDTHVFVDAALPGVDPKDVEVTFDKGVLWLKGETVETEEDKKKKFYRKATSSFSYRVAVPGEIDLGVDPEAVSKHGVMRVTFTKHPKMQPKKITVKAK